MRRLEALGPGRFLLPFVPVLLVLGVFGAVSGEWGLMAVSGAVAAVLGAWVVRLRGHEPANRPPARAWVATVMAGGVFVYAAFALGDEGDFGAALPVSLFAAFALGFVIRGPERR